MGAACTCNRVMGDKEIKLNTYRKSELRLKFEKEKNLSLLILIQAFVRGRKIRKKITQQYHIKLFRKIVFRLFKCPEKFTKKTHNSPLIY